MDDTKSMLSQKPQEAHGGEMCLSTKDELFKNFEKWSKKTGWSVDQLAERAEAINAQWGDIDEEVAWTRTTSALGSQMAREMKSDAKPVVMYFFNAGEARNLSADDYATKKAAYAEDPIKAVAEGLTDDQGTPMDTRSTYPNTTIPNPQYMKALRPFFQAVDVGLAKDPADGKIKFFTLRRRNKQAKIAPPLKTPVVGRVNVRSVTDNQISATSSNITSYVEAEMPEIEGMTITDILQGASDEFKCGPIELLDYIDANPDADMVIVEGDVISGPMETSTGNVMFSLGNVAEDIDFAGVPVFAPMAGNEELLTHGEGSRYVVVGYPREGEDREGNPQATVNANAVGVVYSVEKMEADAPDGDFEF